MGANVMKLDPIGILCALPGELGSLRDKSHSSFTRQGLEFREIDLEGVPLVACVGGVGKVFAARAAALLGECAPRGLLVVGVCGGLRRALVPGTFVHCQQAVQRDGWPGEGHTSQPDPEWFAAWKRVTPGVPATFLTADRAVFSPLRSIAATRGHSGPCVADMETAAAAAVAVAAGRPWAALRVVTDQPSFFDPGAFKRNYEREAGRAANTVPALLSAIPF